MNGYNALHCFIYQDNATRGSHDESCDTDDLSKGMKLLLNSGIDLNDQTRFGYSILHIASGRRDNHLALLYILQNFTTTNITQLTRLGENFLHIYARSDIFENIIDLLETISTHASSVQELLNQRNVNGKTPWSYMVDSANISEESFNSLLRFGISATRLDNLGNSVLNKNLNITCSTYILQHVLRNDQDINKRNVFGQSCLFNLYMEPVLDMLLRYNVDFHTTDRWGRTPFMSIMMIRPRPVVLRKLIENGKADINSRDCYGSTPLHLAAYKNYEEQVELLISYGADVNCVDKLGDKPINTVRRHSSFRCNSIFQKDVAFTKATLYLQNKTIDDILLKMPKTILSSSIESKSPEDIREILGLPQNMREFSTCILEEKYLRNQVHTSEVDEITSNINSLVEALCKRITDYDPRFHMKMFPTGSSAEGTKVGPPDEFDFVLCLSELEKLCEIRVPHHRYEKGYACLFFKDFPHTSEEYLPFSDCSGYFLAFPYLQYLARYLQRAINETKLWQSGNIYYNTEQPFGVLLDKPVFNLEVYWIGSLFKQLKISIDLVPVVYKKGWWPKYISLNDMPLVNEHVASAGCFLMLQTLSEGFYTEFKWESFNDAIVDTCNPDLSNDCWDFRLLRISSAPAEIRLMRSLPEQFRRAYALAKIIVSEIVCPEIEIDKISSDLYSLQKKFKSEKPAQFKPGHLIKSYMLKNCVFYITQELGLTHIEPDDILHVTTMLFDRLLEMSNDYNFVPYFLPFSDVFQFEKEVKRSSYKDYILKLKRQLSIKLVLGMLKH